MWDEIDMDSKTWTIPASRMKANREHRVPLSDQALDVLRQAKRLDDYSGLIFPSALKPGHQLSDMTLTKLLRDNGLADRGDRSRIPNVLQDVVHGTDGHSLGRRGKRL